MEFCIRNISFINKNNNDETEKLSNIKLFHNCFNSINNKLQSNYIIYYLH